MADSSGTRRQRGGGRRTRGRSGAGPSEPLEVRIESLAAGGDGVARGPDGRVLFVPFTVPGDRVRVRVTDPRPRYARGRVEELLEPGPARVDPVCPAFGSCGGCAWQHVDYAAQLEAKRRIVEDALARIGGLHFSGEVGLVASPRPYGYRSRARLLRSGDRFGYRRRRSRAVCAVSRCPVLTEGLERALHELASHPPSGGDGEWELAEGADGVRAVPLSGPRGAPGPSLELAEPGGRLRISPGGFFQANAGLRSVLAEAVVDVAGRGETALEVFAGAGLFTLPLSRRFARVTAIESDLAAARDLSHNLAAGGRDNVAVWAEPLEAALPRLTPVDALVLDPPRSGLPPRSVGPLASLRPRRIAYLSCDPATLARDLASFQAEGYRVAEVTAFDLFPQTPHVEVLAGLQPRAGAA